MMISNTLMGDPIYDTDSKVLEADLGCAPVIGIECYLWIQRIQDHDFIPMQHEQKHE